jgi:hypothetical protein
MWHKKCDGLSLDAGVAETALSNTHTTFDFEKPTCLKVFENELSTERL